MDKKTFNSRDNNNTSRRHAIGLFAAAGAGLLPRPPGLRRAAQTADFQAMPDLTDDGAAGALPEHPQMTHLLDSYRTRPAWKVAGVDYAVGVPAGRKLANWRGLNLPNVTIDGPFVKITSGEVVFDGIDFSAGSGAQLYITGADAVTVRNCRFGGEHLKTVITGIIDTSSAHMTVRNCTFDAAGAGSAACVLFVRQPLQASVNYCHIYDFPCRVIQMIAGGTLDYRFNLVAQGAMQTGAHMNYLEFGSGEARPIVAFNTTAQTALARSSGEGFQFYFNQGGTLHNPLCMHNTMIARGGGANVVMSYLIHGNGYRQGITTALRGRAVVQGNFLDISSAYGAFYSGSFSGWEFHDNTNMVTRQTLPPA